MTRLLAIGRRTFSALSVSNFRRFFFGQSVSMIGTWMQTVAQSWLVYTLTHSATALGFVVALQTLPILVLGPYAGVIADRVDKRKLMIVLQTFMGVQALVLGLLAVTHVVRFWEVCVLAVVLGLNNTFENPARQSFVLEMVGSDELRNAVSLNSTMVNAARAIGPAAAGVLIATVGEGVCFLVNAASFAAVVYSLVSMDKLTLQPTTPTGRHKGQMREGFRYVAHEPRLGIPLVMMALVGTLAYEFQVTLPVIAKQTFHGGPATYGFLTASMGVGAVPRRPRHGRAWPNGASRPHLGRRDIRRRHRVRLACSRPRRRVHRPRGSRVGERDVPRHGQHDPAAAGGPVDARPGHVALGRRLHGHHPGRRPAHRLDNRRLERPRRPRDGRDRVSFRRRHRVRRHAQARPAPRRSPRSRRAP